MMKMKNGFLAAVLLGIGLLTGCSCEEILVINPDLSSQAELAVYTTPEEEKELMQEQGGETTYDTMMTKMGFQAAGTREINGKLNSKYTYRQNQGVTETKDAFVELTNQKAVMNISAESESRSENGNSSSSMDIEDMELYHLVVKHPFQVAATNGTLQADGYTVVYDLKKMHVDKVQRAYAMSASELSKSDVITIKGVKNKKAYKKPVTVKVSSEGALTTFTVNGKNQTENSYYAKMDGKYKVVAKTASGKKKSLTFYVDTKKPATNIKNNKTYNKTVKITFKDKTSGIKKATLNGKKIKSGKKVKKNGTYTLKITDKAGNARIVKFAIQK